ncbi:hypothetical protein BO82DRAFT_136477 [Aspergillus uvarum CBS 121591]|uniref:Uncharacterized protein n=1 Tax=Aspergillus uvarum CBS 121591 TaxID=1448315 RepID=A0A319C5E5_9EURO|nr:hypothetical protein BO82DRAFT_136477 [Aspergillus uvarum CBS 121591]PYH79210.1 hypothetical protein BO82DRAFT_136477 [Aspergillus uvarum CBS 121591]
MQLHHLAFPKPTIGYTWRFLVSTMYLSSKLAGVSLHARCLDLRQFCSLRHLMRQKRETESRMTQSLHQPRISLCTSRS